ncbi:MAG: CAP domain-containing protein [Candidatus Micrarchaeota archaeon]|nr:CAP domain-containing protein [Candidatus Micrarchaeota archaeon]
MASSSLQGLLSLIALCFIAFAVIIMLRAWDVQLPFLSGLQQGNNSYSTYQTVSTISPNGTAPNGQLYAYALSLINKDRNSFGLQNVTLSSESSGQQHSDSMLRYGYFSHWDTYGMKPYMRYTLLGGRGAVSENIAYEEQAYRACIIVCYTKGSINYTKALYDMEYSMMYNDSACCNNGHRNNILDPNHNQVAIGIAYNSSTIYFTEDFIDNYINWDSGSPSSAGGKVSLRGNVQNGYRLSGVEIGYDAPASNMTVGQLSSTKSYSYGNTVAGVVRSSLEYYQNIKTIVAGSYMVNGNGFSISFDMGDVMRQYGAGEYTVEVWLNNTSTGSGFIGSTYTIFIDSSGNEYQPTNV